MVTKLQNKMAEHKGHRFLIMGPCSEEHATVNNFISDGDHESKSSKKNKRRAQKRFDARVEKLKQDGVVDHILEQQDPVTALKHKLQEAKNNKDHKLAAELRHELWIVQDKAAGYSVPETENECQNVVMPQRSEAKPSPSVLQNEVLNPTLPSPTDEMSSTCTPIDKRLRNLKKKLQQIHNLKERKDKGESLEESQVS
ncbi:hypothetical protein QZH41_019462 [Actinostola sp. cb2023]|nr:hypothetical protein QZH41_019462 [Actinostola sp. cb2023]